MRFASSLQSVLLTSILLVTSGCVTSTPQSRISVQRAVYDQFPAEVQKKIGAGQVDVGFTPEMVRMALGKPSREFNRQTEQGSTDVWVYHDNRPRFSFGVGVGSYGGNTASSVGVSTSTGGYDAEEKMRVEFRAGRVTEIEYRKG